MFRAAPAVSQVCVPLARREAWVQQVVFIRQLLAEPGILTALLVLIGIDLVLIAIHVLISGGQYLGMIVEAQAVSLLTILSVTRDASLPEYFNHVKELIMLTALALVWVRSRRMIYLIWSAVLLLILGDDSLRFHEHIGDWVAANLPVAQGSEDGHAFGEIVAWAGYAMVTAALLWWGHRHSSAPERANSWAILAGIVAVSCFAVGVDAVHSIVVRLGAMMDTRLVNGLFGLLEDGGEMLMLSLTCAIVLAIYRRHPRGARVGSASVT